MKPVTRKPMTWNRFISDKIFGRPAICMNGRAASLRFNRIKRSPKRVKPRWKGRVEFNAAYRDLEALQQVFTAYALNAEPVTVNLGEPAPYFDLGNVTITVSDPVTIH